jgi:RimJ/RimL family protein N-acetyltransferase
MDNGAAGSINRGVKGQPSLKTERLLLRPLLVKDAISLRELANSPKIADTCVWLPHPCSEGLAQSWIRGAAERYAVGAGVEFGIQLEGGEELLGVIGFDDRSVNNASAELGFLLDPRWWRKGYATEAADVVVWYGFKYLKLNRIYAHYRVSNPASGRVLAKLRMKQEGLMRQCVRKGRGFEDMVLMALLREEWEQFCQE